MTGTPSYRALVLDLDGTLVVGSSIEVGTVAALRAARARGLRLVLATGRVASELDGEFPGLRDEFDLCVVENGAVLLDGDGEHLLARPVPSVLCDALAARGVAYRRGRVLLAVHADDEAPILEEVHRLALDVYVLRNRSEAMVLPAGVTKGTGAGTALRRMGLSRHDTVAVGDAENDLALFRVAEVAVAVANAVPGVRLAADHVTAGEAGAGVAELILGGFLDRRRPAKRQHVVVGQDDAGVVEVPATGADVLVVGASGSGKSYVLGLLVEQWIDQGYIVLVIDPEGDHAGLRALDATMVFGGHDRLPSPEVVEELVGHQLANVVLDLSSLDRAERDSYLASLAPAIQRVRTATGVPHWIVLDEAHGSFGTGGAWLPTQHLGDGGYCLATYLPEELPDEVVAAMDVVVGVGPMSGPILDGAVRAATVVAGCGPGQARAALAALGTGEVLLAGAEGPLREVRLTRRRTAHLRHARKYALHQVPAHHRFVWRSAGSAPTGRVAGSLAELRDQLATTDAEVLLHHARHRDVSAWVRAVVGDAVTAARVSVAEEAVAGSGDVERFRHELRSAVAVGGA